MKILFALLLATFLSQLVSAQPYKCVLSDKSVHPSQFPCDAARMDKFGRRMNQLFPEVREINPSREYMEGLYMFALKSCEKPFISMTPEQVGKGGEGFFPWQMGAAMAQAAREIICPGLAPPEKPQPLQAHLLIVNSPEAVAKWAQSPANERGSDNGRLRVVSLGAQVHFPIAVTGFALGENGRLDLSADFELVAPDGKVALARKKCCAATQYNAGVPGVAFLDPVFSITSEPSDALGNYTVRVTVFEGARSVTASESFRMQPDAGAGKKGAKE